MDSRRQSSTAAAHERGRKPIGRIPLPPPPAKVLEELERLPISTWRYNWEARDVRHLGPLAQDFADAFGLGENERWIDTVDADGVNIVAIKEVARRLRQLERRIERLERQTQEQRERPDG